MVTNSELSLAAPTVIDTTYNKSNLISEQVHHLFKYQNSLVTRSDENKSKIFDRKFELKLYLHRVEFCNHYRMLYIAV